MATIKEEKKETKKSQPAVPLTPEQKVFKKQSEGGDVNSLKNPYSTSMTPQQAESVIKKYKDFKGAEVPDELARARKILNK